MCAASPARKSRPWRIGSHTTLLMPTITFCVIGPSFGSQPSRVARRARISAQMRSSDQRSTVSAGSHWKYMRCSVGDRVLTSAKPRSCVA